jgi:hypothetical protein
MGWVWYMSPQCQRWFPQLRKQTELGRARRAGLHTRVRECWGVQYLAGGRLRRRTTSRRCRPRTPQPSCRGEQARGAGWRATEGIAFSGLGTSLGGDPGERRRATKKDSEAMPELRVPPPCALYMKGSSHGYCEGRAAGVGTAVGGQPAAEAVRQRPREREHAPCGAAGMHA